MRIEPRPLDTGGQPFRRPVKRRTGSSAEQNRGLKENEKPNFEEPAVLGLALERNYKLKGSSKTESWRSKRTDDQCVHHIMCVCFSPSFDCNSQSEGHCRPTLTFTANRREKWCFWCWDNHRGIKSFDCCAKATGGGEMRGQDQWKAAGQKVFLLQGDGCWTRGVWQPCLDPNL